MDISQRVAAAKPPASTGGVWILVILIIGLLITGGVLYWKHDSGTTPTIITPTPVPKTDLQACVEQKAELETELTALKQHLTSINQVSLVPPKKIIVIKKQATSSTPKDPSNVPQPQPWSSTLVPPSVLKWLQHDPQG